MASRRLGGWRSVKTHLNYDVDQAAKAVGCAKATIRRWIKSNVLPAITDRKPHLILGGDLADCLRARKAPARKMALDEWYCFKCRAPRRPALGMADYTSTTAKIGNLIALCAECGTSMHKSISQARIPELERMLGGPVGRPSNT